MRYKIKNKDGASDMVAILIAIIIFTSVGLLIFRGMGSSIKDSGDDLGNMISSDIVYNVEHEYPTYEDKDDVIDDTAEPQVNLLVNSRGGNNFSGWQIYPKSDIDAYEERGVQKGFIFKPSTRSYAISKIVGLNPRSAYTLSFSQKNIDTNKLWIGIYFTDGSYQTLLHYEEAFFNHFEDRSITFLAEDKIVDELRIYYYGEHSTTIIKDLKIEEGYEKTNWVSSPVDSNPNYGKNLILDAEKEFGPPGREFLTTHDLAPIFDLYGTDKTYSLSFDLKASQSSNQSTMRVYMQNGSSTKYNFVSHSVPISTNWTRHKIEGLKPRISKETDTKAMLAFYGVYNTGNFPMVKNIKLEIGDKATPLSGTAKPNENLIINSDNGGKGWTSSVYNVLQADLKEDWIVGETYTLTIKGEANSGNTLRAWRDRGSIGLFSYIAQSNNEGIYRYTFKAPEPHPTHNYFNKISIYNYQSGNATHARIDWIKLEKGLEPTLWEKD